MTKIENEEQYEAILKRIDELLQIPEDTPLDHPDMKELIYLSDLVEAYEDEHYPMNLPSEEEKKIGGVICNLI